MFGERLRGLIEDYRPKLTMKEFGAKFNLAESTISGYVNETRKPDIDKVSQFADFFRVSVDYLLGVEPKQKEMPGYLPKHKSESILRELVEEYKIDLTENGKKEKLEALIKLVFDDQTGNDKRV